MNEQRKDPIGEMKECKRCGVTLPLACFERRSDRRSYQQNCLTCWRLKFVERELHRRSLAVAEATEARRSGGAS
jgi:hypothetical protein